MRIEPIPHSRPWLTEVEASSVATVVAGGMVAQGSFALKFSSALAELFGLSNVHLTTSGTAALVLALHAAGVHTGSSVVVPTYVCGSVVRAVESLGAQVQLCDIGPCWTVTYESVEQVIDGSTKAIIIPQIFGLHMDLQVFRRFGVPIINDAAQNFDACLTGSPFKEKGDFIVVSFHATKCLTSGEGGGVAATSRAFVESLEDAVRYYPGLSTMSDVSACLGLAQLRRYASFQQRRQRIASVFFENIPANCTAYLRECVSSYFRFPIRQAKYPVAELIKLFGAAGVQARRGMDTLQHRERGLADDAFPYAVGCFQETVSVPAHPSLSDKEVVFVANTAKKLLEGGEV